jgi:septum formation protein
MSTSITEGLYLASQSPRRVELLALLGLYPTVLKIDFEEIPLPQETPSAFVERMARGKARAGLAVLGANPGLVIGADTDVILDGEIFGKPRDAYDAMVMLRRMQGRTHTVLSGVCVVDAHREAFALSVSEVDFAPLTDTEIAHYIATGECFGKAGAYGIQGQAVSFISAIRGSHSGIMGLPLFETAQLLNARMNLA